MTRMLVLAYSDTSDPTQIALKIVKQTHRNYNFVDNDHETSRENESVERYVFQPNGEGTMALSSCNTPAYDYDGDIMWVRGDMEARDFRTIVIEKDKFFEEVVPLVLKYNQVYNRNRFKQNELLIPVKPTVLERITKDSWWEKRRE